MDNDHVIDSEAESTTASSSLLTNWIQTDDRFERMKLKPSVLKAVLRQFEKPNTLQYKTVAPSYLGKDTLIVAPPKTGKTWSAIISVLNNINCAIRHCQVVYLVGDTENAEKVKSLLSSLELPNLLCYVHDTDSQHADTKECFARGVHVIIGTPKSLVSVFSAQTYIKTYRIRMVVLDGAETILSPENIESFSELQQYINWSAQLIVISSQRSKELEDFIIDNMAEPIQIVVNTMEELALIEKEVRSEEVAKKCAHTDNLVSETTPMELDTSPTPGNVTSSSGVPVTVSEDEFDVFVKLVAVKMRNSSPEEQARIRQILNLVILDTLPKYCDIDQLVKNMLPESRRSQCTQTDDIHPCNEKEHLLNNKLVVTSLFRLPCYDNITPVTCVKRIDHFEDAPLKPQVKKGIMYDFKRPLFLQQKTLKLLLNGYDMLIQSPACTGKTTAIFITALNMINVDPKECQAVIVFPTLECVYQMQENLFNISQFVRNVSCRSVCNELELKNYLQNRAHVIVTVPEFLTSIELDTSALKLFAIERVDEIFSESAGQVLSNFMSNLSGKVQIIITRSHLVESIPVHVPTRHFLQVNITPDDLVVNGIKQFCVYVRNEDRRYRKLCELVKIFSNIEPIVVFCNTNHEVLELSNRLFVDGIESAVSLTERLSEQDFNGFMHKFKRKTKRVLISWDYCTSCINLDSIPILVNYVIPFRRENFVERIRRSGRFKDKSRVVNFVTHEEKPMLMDMVQTHCMAMKEVVNCEDIDLDKAITTVKFPIIDNCTASDNFTATE